MITLLTGIPGSGKSYMAVYHVSKMKDQSKVLHNIEGFTLGISLDQFSLDHGIKKTDVFRKSWHEKNDFLHGFTIIIDEAAELFPKSLKDTDIVSFFDYHRHYGIDIFLITQDIKKVTPDITCLAENHYRAASGASNPIPGVLIYQQMVGGEAVSRKYLKKDKKVFALYKSTNNFSSSTLSIGKIYLAGAILATIVAVFAAKHWLSTFKPKETASTAPSSRPVSPVSSPPLRSKPNQSLPSLIGGTPVVISTIRDYSGEYIVFCGNFYRKEHFPYPVVKSRTGLVALLPSEALAFVDQYNEKFESSLKSSSPSGGEKSNKPTLDSNLKNPLAALSERER